MNETSRGGTVFGISIGIAFVGGYADASSYLLARTFNGHLTGNCVLAAVSAASKEWYLTLDRLLAVIVFLAGILVSLLLNRFVPVRLRPYSLAIAMFIGLFVTLGCVARVSGRKTGAKAIEIIAIIAVGSLVKTLLKPSRFGRYSHIAG